jgi:hypothetical protein
MTSAGKQWHVMHHDHDEEQRMPSPFPGMDPYLEGEMWQEFHATLINAIRTQLMHQLRPKYVALLAKRYVFGHSAFGIVDMPAEQRTIYPDVHVVAPHEAAAHQSGPSTVVLAEPSIELASPVPEEIPLLSVEIRDVAQRRLVTIIELLSPVNKRGAGAREYAERRGELLRTSTHLLEIDLLRQGSRIELLGTPPVAPYYVYLSRSERRPYTQVWAVALRQALPVVPVPLLPPDPDVALDVQAALEACFDLVGYEQLLDYSAPLPPPELSAEDAAWVAARLEQHAP